MNKTLFFSLTLLGFYTVLLGQSPNNKMLFVIDSIPILNDPEDWNPVLLEDIADMHVINNKDSVTALGYKKLEGITYIFTKEYRKRPNSLKSIPSLRQMVFKNEAWNLHDKVYSGKYIDYYNSGKIQNEGTLLNGKLQGLLIVYFKNSSRKSVADYKNGVLNGDWREYYTNGALMQTRAFVAGLQEGAGTIYFINGQIQHEVKLKKDTPYDTAFSYYSTGKLRQMTVIRNHAAVLSKSEEAINYYTPQFYQSIHLGDIRQANKSFFEIWKRDSTNIDTYFKGGLLLLKEGRFDKAIAEFDKALNIEPLMREALVHRALARLKKNQALRPDSFPKNDTRPVTVEDIDTMPLEEQRKVCDDLRQAESVDFTESFIKTIVPEIILNYCHTMGGL